MTDNSENALFNSFFQDSDVFILEINRDLMELEKSPQKGELVDKVFRAAHSLKSEADYLNQGEIAGMAHRIEGALEAIRSSHGIPTRGQFDEFFSCIDRIQEMLDQLKQEKLNKDFLDNGAGPQDLPIRKEDSPVTSDSLSPSNLGPSGQNDYSVRLHQPDMSDFEKVLLRESMQRGEKFFRISVDLDSSCPMPYAKAYLLLNNLEQLVHVVHTWPAFGAENLDMDDQSRFLQPVFYCTASIDEERVYRAIHVDLVKSIKISPLEYSSIFDGPQQEVFGNPLQTEFSVKIDGDDLDNLNSYVDELKIRAHRLKRDLKNENSEVQKQLSILTALIRSLEDFTRKISLVNLKDVLQHHGRLVRDQARKMEKDVQLVLQDCEITIDRRAAELISDMVLHLLRNAVVHGIETPVERRQARKNVMGTLTISASDDSGQLVITVRDDGAGIDEQEIRRLAFERGVRTGDMKGEDAMSQLLACLIHPGLTTRLDADAHSGRGFGLDLVYRKIRQFEGGKLELQTKPGEGTSFMITLPSGFSVVPLLIVRYRDGMYALPSKYIEGEANLEEGNFSAGERGELLWSGMNVFSPDGRLYHTDTQPAQKKGLIISYLKNRSVLLIDEVLFQKEIPEDSMTLYIAGSPYLHRLDLYGNPSDFLYLSPSLVVL